MTQDPSKYPFANSDPARIPIVFEKFWNPENHQGETFEQASKRWSERDTPFSAQLHEMSHTSDRGRSAIIAAFGQSFWEEIEQIDLEASRQNW